jgi:hypothetical protein
MRYRGPSNVLRRSAAGWDGCCPKGGEAAVVDRINQSLDNGKGLPNLCFP